MLSAVATAVVVTVACPVAALADSITIPMNLTDAAGLGRRIGAVKAKDTPYGLLLTPNLTGLTPGIHGFHIHQHPNCGPAEKNGQMVPGLAAGGHFDPFNTNRHEGPYGNGHLGDLPPLMVDGQGVASTPVLAPRLKLAYLHDRSLMVHLHGDNYSDVPKPLGGGGPRAACGIIKLR